jgi:hypothetical protein
LNPGERIAAEVNGLRFGPRAGEPRYDDEDETASTAKPNARLERR